MSAVLKNIYQTNVIFNFVIIIDCTIFKKIFKLKFVKKMFKNFVKLDSNSSIFNN
jgi:hypothetical protein